jgi:hypothetical protein
MLLQVARRLRRSSIGCFDVAVTQPAMFARNSIGSPASGQGCSLDAMEDKWWRGAEREIWMETARRRSMRCGRRARGGGA